MPDEPTLFDTPQHPEALGPGLTQQDMLDFSEGKRVVLEDARLKCAQRLLGLAGPGETGNGESKNGALAKRHLQNALKANPTLELGKQFLVLTLEEFDAVNVFGKSVVELAEHLLLLVALLFDGEHRHGLDRRHTVVVVVAVRKPDTPLDCGSLYFYLICHFFLFLFFVVVGSSN